VRARAIAPARTPRHAAIATTKSITKPASHAARERVRTTATVSTISDTSPIDATAFFRAESATTPAIGMAITAKWARKFRLPKVPPGARSPRNSSQSSP
jgi:hypothetical protein